MLQNSMDKIREDFTEREEFFVFIRHEIMSIFPLIFHPNVF